MAFGTSIALSHSKLRLTSPVGVIRHDQPSRRLRMSVAQTPATEIPHHVASFLSRSREGNPLAALPAADRAFNSWKEGTRRIPKIVRQTSGLTLAPSTSVDVDVTVVGGTLGIFFATALQARGVRVAIIERGRLQGRTQEWNISRDELQALVRESVLTQEEIEMSIVNEFARPSRIGFVGASDDSTNTQRQLTVGGVLNLGVSPAKLVELALQRFQQLGGTVLQFTALEDVLISDDEVKLSLRQQRKRDGALGAGGTGRASEAEPDAKTEILRARLLVDAMGSFSPIAAQARGAKGAKPDGVCITVGSCIRGKFPDNNSSDLLYAFQPIDEERNVQYFWEAFPAGKALDCRTTYMFTYGACNPQRQTLTDALDDYVKLLPQYQGVNVDDFEVERVLFAFFPCFRDSPSRLAFDRILPVGDAAGFQSPISFGGFGSCLRHLRRITSGIQEALSDDALLKKQELQRMQFYNPSLSVAWLFNSAMSVDSAKMGRQPFVDNYIINDLLWTNMRAMEQLGPNVQRPFLQDVVTCGGLSKTLAAMMVRDPGLVFKTLAFVGPWEVGRWLRHYLALVVYSLVAPVATTFQSRAEVLNFNNAQKYRLNRLVDMLRYGSGLDHSG